MTSDSRRVAPGPGVRDPRLVGAGDNTEEAAVEEVANQRSIAAIMPPIALLNNPAPIIGITTVWAMTQSAMPQRVPRTPGGPGR
jgi:hypothetical protein